VNATGESASGSDAHGDDARARGASPGTSDTTHTRQLLVWGTPASIECGQSFSVTVGVKCEAACPPGGQPDEGPGDWRVEVRDHDGTTVATATLGPDPWPETAALYYARIELTAPDAEGLHSWHALAPALPAQGAATQSHAHSNAAAAQRRGADDADTDARVAPVAGHSEARADFSVRTVPTPDCVLTVVAVDRETQSPIAGAKVAVHPYRAVTDARGIAELRVPKGHYRLFVSGRDRFAFRGDGEVTTDITVRAELDPDLGPTDAELWS
jgi:hypothetical protein